tara:strand:- start:1302 stop:1562 length:261 start_codon:yes stop_codon:yes gene_type:complete
MKLTKEQLKQIIKEELEEAMGMYSSKSPREVESAILNSDGWQNGLPSQAWQELWSAGFDESDLQSVLEINTDAEMHDFIYAMLSEA